MKTNSQLAVKNPLKTLFFLIIILSVTSCFRVQPKIEEGMSIQLTEYAELPESINECSGMVYHNEHFFILNDGGDSARIFELDETGEKIIVSHFIDGIKNIDWESLSYYDNSFIIGDLGNNRGRRKDLSLIHLDSNWQVSSKIAVHYPEQKRFDVDKHNFDCEAFMVVDDQYVLFTKNRGNKNSSIYTEKVGEDNFYLLDSIELKGQVTDGVYHRPSDTYILTCYQFKLGRFTNTIALIKRKNNQFKVTNIFNVPYTDQIEAITWKKDNVFFLGSELGFGNGGKIYEMIIQGL